MKRILLSLICLCIVTVALAQNKVVIQTEYGKIVLSLYDNTPKHRDNMAKLVKEKFYDSTLFHRVIPGFVVQGGDPQSKTAKKGDMLGGGDMDYKIPAEINDENYHMRGAVGMARDNNPSKESSGCQFYIVVGKKFTDAELDNISAKTGRQFTKAQREVYKAAGGTPHLDGNYTVYGVVEEGMDVVDKIAAEERDLTDRPKKDVRMLKVTMLKKKKRFLFF